MAQILESSTYDIAELVRRMNAVPAGQHGRPRWDRWSGRLFLEASGVQLIQRSPRRKLYVTGVALLEAFPRRYVEALLAGPDPE